jgi:hypothetical protein
MNLNFNLTPKEDSSHALAVARTRICTVLLLLIATVIVVAPIYESLDRWDKPVEDGNDTVLTVTGALALLGAAFVLNAAVSLISHPLSDSRPSSESNPGDKRECWLVSVCIPTESPPAAALTLRI